MKATVSDAQMFTGARTLVEMMFRLANNRVDQLSACEGGGIRCTPYVQLHMDDADREHAFVAVHAQRLLSTDAKTDNIDAGAVCSSVVLLYGFDVGVGQLQPREHAAFELPGPDQVRSSSTTSSSSTSAVFFDLARER